MFSLNGLRDSEPPTDLQNPAATAGGNEDQDAQASKTSPPVKTWQLINDQTTRQKLLRFRAGTTGTGLIDASLRELFRTGYTSNRTRQNVASFLSKRLNIDWRVGAEWYECMLVDYDCASNWGNWQYVAGVGNDPAKAAYSILSSKGWTTIRRGSTSRLGCPSCVGWRSKLTRRASRMRRL